MDSGSRVTLKWHGAAHHHIAYRDLRIVIDPLYSRLPGEKPRLEATSEDIEKIDYLLLTHGHLDHSWDFPELALRHAPKVFGPEKCLADIEKAEMCSGSRFDRSRWHSLERIKGTAFSIGDIAVTPHQIGTEDIDFWFIRSMFVRPWIHGRPLAIVTGLKWLMHHVFGNCFSYLFRFPVEGASLLFFGNLTGNVDELQKIDRVDILAIPYCPANQRWIEQSVFLIERFRPNVTMVHHFDNFMNPFTLSKYMNLENYRQIIQERCPDAHFYFSKFEQSVDLADIANTREKTAAG